MTHRESVVKRNLNFIWLPIALIVIVIFIVVLRSDSAPNSSGVSGPGDEGNIIPATEEPTNNPEPELVFFGDLGIILYEKGEEHFAYILGRKAPLGPDVPPEYGFPLYIERDAGTGNETQTKLIASIPDPNINEIGEEWDSGPIKDPDYEGFLLRVVLTRTVERVKEIYNYEISFYFSPDNGQSWLSVSVR